MLINTVVSTDTATIVAFDPVALAPREADECDWWTGEGDLQREEDRRTLVFIDTGSDGSFDLTVTDALAPVGLQQVKTSTLSIPSGHLLFGAGELLPGDGPPITKRLGTIQVAPGQYEVRVLVASEPKRRYAFALSMLGPAERVRG